MFDAVGMIKCFKSNAYNHKAAECKNEETGLRWHGKHSTNSYTKQITKKCQHATEMNLDIYHERRNKLCPVYMNKLESNKKKSDTSNQRVQKKYIRT